MTGGQKQKLNYLHSDRGGVIWGVSGGEVSLWRPALVVRDRHATWAAGIKPSGQGGLGWRASRREKRGGE